MARIVLLLGLLALATANADPVVLFPSTLYAGTNASLSVSGATEALTVALRNASGTVASVPVPAMSEPQVVGLEVPSGIKGPHSVVMTTASGATVGEEQDVTVQPANYFLMIELDKLVYKPGQMVRARVLAVDPFLMPSPGKDVVVELQSPSEFTLERWEREMHATTGIATVQFQSSSSLALGTYTLKAYTVTADGDKLAETSRTFSVDKYVLPRFEVNMSTVQDTLSEGYTQLAGTVTATTTYGEPVQGQVTVHVYKNPSPMPFYGGGLMVGAARMAFDAMPGPSGGSLEELDFLVKDIAGSADFYFDLDLEAAGLRNLYGSLSVTAEVTEAATGETQNTSAAVGLRTQAYQVDLMGGSYFQPGLDYTLTVEVKRASLDLSVASTVSVQATIAGPYGTPDVFSQNYTVTLDPTSASGALVVALPPEDPTCCDPSDADGTYSGQDTCCQNQLKFQVTMMDDNDLNRQEVDVNDHYVSRAASTSGVYLSGAQANTSDDTMVVVDVDTTSSAAVVSWALLGRLGVLAVGDAAQPGPSRISVPLTVELRASMGTRASLLLWFATGAASEKGAELVAARVELSTPGALTHTVSATFSTVETTPGAEVEVALAAGAAARVYILAVDKSVRLQAGGSSELTTAQLLAGAAAFTPTAGDEACQDLSAEAAMQAAGVVVLSNIEVPTCTEPHFEYAAMADGAGDVGGLPEAAMRTNKATEGLTEVEAVRQFFPESWLWEAVDMGENGTATHLTTVPDTITTWELSAFGVSATHGLGVAPGGADLKVFKDFFIELALPYSIVRGEVVTLKVGVYNYMNQANNVTVELQLPEGGMLELVNSSTSTVTTSVDADATASVTFDVRGTATGVANMTVTGRTSAATAGRSDAMQRALNVIAEGVPATTVRNLVLSLNGSTVTENLAVVLPDDLVLGSNTTRMTLVGDLMGQTISGLGALLTVPYGCGEQNMITMAPNVYVLQYLRDTGKLTAALRERAESNMKQGYQRELNYMHPDNSFSAFGTTDSAGSTWLTAFVVRVFAQAAKFLYVDPGLIAASMTWLQNLQDAQSGAFNSSGEVIHKEMQGGTSSGVSLSAFVLIALVQAGAGSDGAGTAVVSRAVGYLEAQMGSTGAFASVISTYAMALACKELRQGCESTESALDALQESAVEEGGLIHWEPAAGMVVLSHGGYSDYGGARASHIEITGYALMALVAGGRTGVAFPAARWLLQQRNEFGGFSSTQDTVVGLEALSEYAKAVYGEAGAVSIQLSMPRGWSQTATVDASNLDLLQRWDLPAGDPVVQVSASGTGMALLQLTVQYNTAQRANENVYDLNVTWRYVQDPIPGREMVADVCATQVQDLGADDPGMVLLEVSCFSGYTPAPSSLEALVGQGPVKRADISADGRRAEIYLQELTETEVCLTFYAAQQFVVMDLQPAVATVSAYYDSSLTKSIPVASDANYMKNAEKKEEQPVRLAVPPPPAKVQDLTYVPPPGKVFEKPLPSSAALAATRPSHTMAIFLASTMLVWSVFL